MQDSIPFPYHARKPESVNRFGRDTRRGQAKAFQKTLSFHFNAMWELVLAYGVIYHCRINHLSCLKGIDTSSTGTSDYQLLNFDINTAIPTWYIRSPAFSWLSSGCSVPPHTDVLLAMTLLDSSYVRSPSRSLSPTSRDSQCRWSHSVPSAAVAHRHPPLVRNCQFRVSFLPHRDSHRNTPLLQLMTSEHRSQDDQSNAWKQWTQLSSLPALYHSAPQLLVFLPTAPQAHPAAIATPPQTVCCPLLSPQPSPPAGESLCLQRCCTAPDIPSAPLESPEA